MTPAWLTVTQIYELHHELRESTLYLLCSHRKPYVYAEYFDTQINKYMFSESFAIQSAIYFSIYMYMHIHSHSICLQGCLGSVEASLYWTVL